MLVLADTSAWIWSRKVPELRDGFDHRLREGVIAICDMVKLELLYLCKNGREFDLRRGELEALPYCPIGVEEWHEALDVYRALAQQGGKHQRSVKHADLLIAAAARSAEIPVLHYDEDFDRVTEVTGQPTEWIAKRGSLR